MIDTIFVPRGSEERAVRRALGRARSSARVVPTGIGPLAGERAAREALGGARIGAALVMGLCGVLSPAFDVAETLVYASVVRDGAPEIGLDPGLTHAVGARVTGAQTGIRALATERVITSAREKRVLGRRTGAQAVDMESYAVAHVLGERGVALAIVRVASDGVHDDLPDLDMALDGAGGIDGFALALAMLRRPFAGIGLARNGTRALAALERSAYAIVR